MEELLHKLGIDWKLLLAQAVNFGIVLFVLYKFAYKPILKLLHDRENKVSTSLKNAEKVEENLKKSKIERENQIALGRKEAEKIVEEAILRAEEARKSKLDLTKKDAAEVVREAKEKIVLERKSMVDGVKNELGELVLLASRRVTKDSIDPRAQKKLIEEAISDLKTAKI
ncbi:MAG TPA: F0F1 ATP synthase subunit B [Candidatus Bipolaricaulota bacterium]|nr:F0F1 ATP synthase subunit B [Candidatus Bipolaricaulota bacterium]